MNSGNLNNVFQSKVPSTGGKGVTIRHYNVSGASNTTVQGSNKGGSDRKLK
jgi:hypothetical protein